MNIQHVTIMMLDFALFLMVYFSPVSSESQDIEKDCTGENVYYNRESKICTECPTTCPVGYGYFQYKCGYGKMEQERCSECTVESGTFSSADDNSRCMLCKMCLNRQIITQCTPTSDSKCGPCNDGYGWDEVRQVCKLCQHARKELPGCEEPPTISTLKKLVYICKSMSSPDKYSWFRNDELLDTSDEKKYFVEGTILVVKSDLDDGVYKCRAEWNANSDFNFEIKKMSSNNITIWPTYEPKYENGPDEITTKPKQVAHGHRTVTFNCLKSWEYMVLCVGVGFLCLLIPNTCVTVPLNWLWNRINLGGKLRVFQGKNCQPSVKMPLDQSSGSEIIALAVDIGQNPSETSDLVQKIPEPDLKSIYRNALDQSSGLYYHDLDINITDRLGMLLNPHIDPKPPIKFWKHLACELGVNDAVVVNSLGSYKDFHQYLQTQCITMETFLKALWKVENIEATNIVCKAVLKKESTV